MGGTGSGIGKSAFMRITSLQLFWKFHCGHYNRRADFPFTECLRRSIGFWGIFARKPCTGAPADGRALDQEWRSGGVED